MKTLSKEIVGPWRLNWMELWSQDAVDLVGPGFLQLEADGSGEMHFIAVKAWLDCEPVERDGRPAVEFSWEGTDERDRRSGRGWVRLVRPDALEGVFCFHMGDTSPFRAERSTTAEFAKARTQRTASRRRRTSAGS